MTKRPKHFKRTERLQPIRLEPALKQAIDQYAEDKGVPVSTAVHDALAELMQNAGYIKVQKVQVRPTAAPVEDIEYIYIAPE